MSGGLLRHVYDHMTTFHPYLRTKVWIGIATLLIVSVAYVVFLYTLTEPRIWSGVRATSEYAAFKVTRPEFVALRVAGMKAISLESPGRCVDGIVAPKAGAWVEYRRGDRNEIEIHISPAPGERNSMTLTGAENPDSVMEGEVDLSVDKACPGEPPSRLPIYGPAVFGRQQEPVQADGPRPWMLLKGSVDIYALAQERVLLMRFPSTVYLLSNFELPPGSVLCADIAGGGRGRGLDCAGLRSFPGEDVSKENHEIRTWVGVATPVESGNGFDIAATTRAPGLIMEASYSYGREALTHVDLGTHGQSLKDPNLLWVQFRVGVLLLILQSVLSMINFFAEGKKPEEAPPAKGEFD